MFVQCVYICEYLHVCVYAYTWRPEVNLRCVSSGVVPLDFRDLDLTTKAKSILLHLSRAGITGMHLCPVFPLGSRDGTQVLVLLRQMLSWPSHLHSRRSFCRLSPGLSSSRPCTLCRHPACVTLQENLLQLSWPCPRCRCSFLGVLGS